MLLDLNAEEQQKLEDYIEKCDKAYRKSLLSWDERRKAIERFKVDLIIHSFDKDIK